MSVNYGDFIHPDDAAARRELESVAGFDKLTKLYMKLGVEKLLQSLFMAEKIRLSPTQLPEYYNLLPPVCEKFGIKEPQFYLEMSPIPNAYTVGDNETFLVVTSGLLEYMSRDEQQAVIAHECGHILCRHVFYNTLAMLLISWANNTGFFGEALNSPIILGDILGTLAAPLRLALNYWSRKSELSADRAEVVFMGSSAATVRGLIRLAGGPSAITANVNIEEYAKQADTYQQMYDSSTWQKILQGSEIMNRSHPFNAVRVREVLAWEKSAQFIKLREAILSGGLSEEPAVCMKCGNSIKKGSKYCRYCGFEQ